MKNPLLLLVSPILYFLSCQSPVPDKMGDDLSGVIKNKDSITQMSRRLLTDFIKSDTVFANSILSDSCKFYLPGVDTIAKSKKDFFAFLKSAHQVYSNWKTDSAHLHLETEYYKKDNNIWSNIWVNWSYTGNFSHKNYLLPAHYTLQWKNNKVIVWVGYSDTYNNITELASQKLTTKPDAN